jgi:hypothetical protein
MTAEQFVAYVQAILDSERERGNAFERKAADQIRMFNKLNGVETEVKQSPIEFVGSLGLIEKALHQVQNPNS